MNDSNERDDIARSRENATQARSPADAEPRVLIEGRAERVVLFEDRAEVTRVAAIQAQEGTQWVSISGASPLVDDRSVQAKPLRGAQVLAVRVLRRSRMVGELGQEQVDALEAEADALRARLRQLEWSLKAVEDERSHADALFSQWRVALSEIPRDVHQVAVADAWSCAFEELSEAALDVAREQSALSLEREEVRRALQRGQERLAQGRALQPAYETRVEVQIHAPEAGDVELEITYRLPCALWRPEHLARLRVAPSGETSIELLTWATVWQNTGETWSDVEVTFSTARPAQIATPPMLDDDRITCRTKSNAERRTLVVSAHEQSISVAGGEGLGGTTPSHEMPGVDDGGEPLRLSPSERVSLHSDGLPVRVEVSRVHLNAEVTRVVYPEKHPVAHLKATATLPAGADALPLLAGPVLIAREQGLMGRSKLDFVAPGDTFQLGFGPDEGVRVRRTQSQQRHTRSVSHSQRIERTVEVFLSCLSDEPRDVEVIERIPVSEVKEIEVTLTRNHGGWRVDSDGFLKATLRLVPGDTRTLEYEYELQASSRVALPHF